MEKGAMFGTNALAEKLKIKITTLSSALSRFQDDGLVMLVRRGTWQKL